MKTGMATVRGLLATALLAGAVGLATAEAAAEENARGAQLFEFCSNCHGIDGGGNRGFLAPAIAGLDEWYVLVQLQKFRGGLRGTHFDDISGMRMRPMSLWLQSDEDVAAVAKYVASLAPVHPARELSGGDPAKGQATYAALCITCHGPRGEGMQALNGPPIANLNDWYLFSQLGKFRAGVRGANPQDPIAIMMRPMSLSLPNEQAMLDVVAYITTLAGASPAAGE